MLHITYNYPHSYQLNYPGLIGSYLIFSKQLVANILLEIGLGLIRVFHIIPYGIQFEGINLPNNVVDPRVRNLTFKLLPFSLTGFISLTKVSVSLRALLVYVMSNVKVK